MNCTECLIKREIQIKLMRKFPDYFWDIFYKKKGKEATYRIYKRKRKKEFVCSYKMIINTDYNEHIDKIISIIEAKK